MNDPDRKYVDGIIDVYFDPCQADLLRQQVREQQLISGCIYPIWKFLAGRGKNGEFAMTIARHFFLSQGYRVLHSDSSREHQDSFVLASYPGLRRERPLHPAYERMVRVFGIEKLEAFNKVAATEKLKRKSTNNSGGGDPDLFVECSKSEHSFFAEVKYKDKLLENQKAVFPLISKMLGCKVFLVQIRPLQN